ncbi:hypothetical protein SASPL_122071 [Salvia splendens]|uniref:Uncharacterized protein n=1 Tax=Salvia splendens TaxID=180675 RepID=A0A8X8XJD6_SALSN|nr:hypothetical protein SASPL_122071 [Salvia splendens]
MAEQNRGGGKADDQFTRCPHCAGPLTKEMETSKWTVSPLVREGFSMIGTAVGGIAGAVYGFNHSKFVLFSMPVVRRRIKGPMWLQFFVGLYVTYKDDYLIRSHLPFAFPLSDLSKFIFLDAGATCHYFLIRMCRASRWFTSGFGSTCIFILSCLSVLPTISTFVLVELGIYWLWALLLITVMVSRAVSVTKVPFCHKVHAHLINGSAFFIDLHHHG